jgi:hypothetical protein
MSHNCFFYCLICFTSLRYWHYLFNVASLSALFVLRRHSAIGLICFTSLHYWHYLFYVASLLALFVLRRFAIGIICFTSLRYWHYLFLRRFAIWHYLFNVVILSGAKNPCISLLLLSVLVQAQ